jgi:hypothetical protein
MNRRRVGEDRGSKETVEYPLTWPETLCSTKQQNILKFTTTTCAIALNLE